MTRLHRKLLYSGAFVAALIGLAALGQPAPAVFAALVATPAFVLAGFYFALRRKRDGAWLHFAKALFYGLALLVAVPTNQIYD